MILCNLSRSIPKLGVYECGLREWSANAKEEKITNNTKWPGAFVSESGAPRHRVPNGKREHNFREHFCLSTPLHYKHDV